MNNTVDSLSINESLESENTVSNEVNPENIQTWDNDKADKTKDSRTNQAASIGLSTDSTEMTEEVIEETENSAVVSNNNEQNEELVESVTGISSADEGINYRVQICATKKVAEKNYFKKHKNFNFDVTIENHEGWIKYTTGEYPLYKQARNSRSLIDENYDLDGPFVAAYNYGERITVQEAIMISNQKWFK